MKNIGFSVDPSLVSEMRLPFSRIMRNPQHTEEQVLAYLTGMTNKYLAELRRLGVFGVTLCLRDKNKRVKKLRLLKMVSKGLDIKFSKSLSESWDRLQVGSESIVGWFSLLEQERTEDFPEMVKELELKKLATQYHGNLQDAWPDVETWHIDAIDNLPGSLRWNTEQLNAGWRKSDPHALQIASMYLVGTVPASEEKSIERTMVQFVVEQGRQLSEADRAYLYAYAHELCNSVEILFSGIAWRARDLDKTAKSILQVLYPKDANHATKKL